MRARTLILVLALASTSSMCGLTQIQVSSHTTTNKFRWTPSVPVATQPSSTASAPSKVDFTTQVKPIMEARCQPCHFQGGTMYDKLPFDRPQTIKTLGEKLFTRLKQENDRQVIRQFLVE